MTLQTQVQTDVAIGVPGARADLSPFDYHPQTMQAEGAVFAGSFVWLGTDAETQARASGSGTPLGFVERALVYPSFEALSEGTLEIADGQSMNVAVRGAFYAITKTDATVGQSVFADTADGSVLTGASGTSVSGAVETGWKAVTAGSAGETIIISNRS